MQQGSLASEFDDTYYLQELASEGDKDAALMLAKDFDDLRYLKLLAEGGDIAAATELASSEAA